MASSVLQNVIHPNSPTSDTGGEMAGFASINPSGQEFESVLGVLVENAPVAMAMFDQNMHYLLANRAWVEEFGLQNVQPLIGKSQYDIFPGLHPGWRQVYERALLGHVIRSEHDALSGPDGARVVYRWEVRPWRRKMSANVGGLMVTCERFGESSAAQAGAEHNGEENTRPPRLFDCAVPLLLLDEQGVIHQSNKEAASLCLSRGIQEGVSEFWEVFAEAAQRTMLKQLVLETLDHVAENEAIPSKILDMPVLSAGHSAWAAKEVGQTTAGPRPTRWLFVRAGADGEKKFFSVMALPAEATPRVPLAAPSLPAIANAVASISQPPTTEVLNNSLEMRRLQDDLTRAKQELRTLSEAGRTFSQRDARAKQYLDVLPCGVLVLDELGAPVYQNEPLTKLLGRPVEKDETVEQWLAAACPSERHREDVSALWREDVWRRQLTRTFSLATADGLLKDLEFQPASLPGGGLLICIQDATEKCRHEEQLRATEAKFRTLLQESPLAVVLLDKTGSVFDVNHLAESLFGHPRNELRRYPLDAWLEAESADKRREAVREMELEGKRAASLRVKVKQGDGTSLPARLHLAQVTDSEGDPYCTIHFFERAPQVTVEAEPQSTPLAAPAAKKIAAQPVLAAPVLLFKTNVNGRIKECSERGCTLLGITADEALGRPLHEHFSPSDASGFYNHLGTLSQNPATATELTCYAKGGQRKTCRVIVSPGGWSGADYIIHEMADAHAAAAAPVLAENDSLERMTAISTAAPWPAVNLDREKLLLSETHHRIKNHLQIISSLLNLESNSITDTGARHALRSSQNRVRSIADLHQHLYQVALGTDGSFTDFATGLLERLRECYQVSEESVAVKLDLQAGTIQQEWLMPLALTLNETLSNCFEHAFPEGRHGEVMASLTFGPDFGELIVRDDGIGLSESLRPGSGTGLGLKILAVFAEQMRGQLLLGRVDSGGTEIRLRFPIASADN